MIPLNLMTDKMSFQLISQQLRGNLFPVHCNRGFGFVQ